MGLLLSGVVLFYLWCSVVVFYCILFIFYCWLIGCFLWFVVVVGGGAVAFI